MLGSILSNLLLVLGACTCVPYVSMCVKHCIFNMAHQMPAGRPGQALSILQHVMCMGLVVLGREQHGTQSHSSCKLKHAGMRTSTYISATHIGLHNLHWVLPQLKCTRAHTHTCCDYGSERLTCMAAIRLLLRCASTTTCTGTSPLLVTHMSMQRKNAIESIALMLALGAQARVCSLAACSSRCRHSMRYAPQQL